MLAPSRLYSAPLPSKFWPVAGYRFQNGTTFRVEKGTILILRIVPLHLGYGKAYYVRLSWIGGEFISLEREFDGPNFIR